MKLIFTMLINNKYSKGASHFNDIGGKIKTLMKTKM